MAAKKRGRQRRRFFYLKKLSFFAAYFVVNLNLKIKKPIEKLSAKRFYHASRGES